MNPKELKVVFGDNYRIDVDYKGFTVKTDQPVHDGGDGTAPSPFDYFLVSLASCAGFYALAFCRERQVKTPDARRIQCDSRRSGLAAVLPGARCSRSSGPRRSSAGAEGPSGFSGAGDPARTAA